MDRTMLRDDQWARIEQLLPGKKGDPGCTAKDNRRFVEAVLWIMRTGSPWRDLPLKAWLISRDVILDTSSDKSFRNSAVCKPAQLVAPCPPHISICCLSSSAVCLMTFSGRKRHRAINATTIIMIKKLIHGLGFPVLLAMNPYYRVIFVKIT